MSTVDLKTPAMSIKLINIYAPNIDSPAFFKRIFDIIDTNPMDYFLLCGDFNLVINPDLDSDKYKNINNPQSRKLLLNSINGNNWKDIFRQLHPNAKRFTL